ncbi:MAG: acetyltransferase [Paludibacteraceae bacterium]|nr:acetyltransferase [Paludibacteraceae bacterium]MEE3484960.1 acetyltransferase [Bacteroidales bacterium]
MKPLILIGGGGHCKSVIDVAESAGYRIAGILDRPEEFGKKILNYEVIGNDDDISKYVRSAEFIISVGYIRNPDLRIKLYDLVKQQGGQFATLIASTAYVSRYASLDEGTVVMHHAFVNAEATVGKNVILNTFSNIEHGSIVGDQCHISTGVMVNGDCKVGDNCFIGSGTVLYNGVSITDGVVVSAGSVVRRSISIKGVYSGNPAGLKIRG